MLEASVDTPHFLFGIIFTIMAGVLQGSMLWPMKFMRKWEWENIWLGFCTSAYLLAPWILALRTVPHLGQVIGSVAPRILAITALFGLGWGAGIVLFGLGINALGLGIAYTITMSLNVAVGTLTPFAILATKDQFSRHALRLVSGVIAVFIGTAICSYAAKRRETRVASIVVNQHPMPQRSFVVGVILCVCAGVLLPCGNLALVFGSDLIQQARLLGSSLVSSANALWAVTTIPLFVSNASYCSFLLSRNKTLRRYRCASTRWYWLSIVVMGTFQITGIVLYGFGAISLGALGPSLAYPTVISSMIVTANLLGLASGEWKGLGRATISLMIFGLTLLTGAIFLIGIQ
jgi:L-rhamnose-H+ transport protein